MILSDKSLSKINIIYYLRMIILLIMGFMISPTEAAVTCNSDSLQCCWLRRIWELMGKTTAVSPKSATACCRYLGSETQSSGIPGVFCDSSGALSKLRWGNRGLTGSIPHEIGNLTNLQWLELHNNQLTGSIPHEIGNLVTLERLVLAGNQLNGAIPDTIGNLMNLEFLSLSDNQLTGHIPPEIGNLTSLTELYLNDNQLSGSIPSTIGNLVNLFRLCLRYNKLTGTIPPEIEDLTNLKTLWINGNVDISGAITPQCSTQVYTQSSGVFICGCASASSPASLFPPPGTKEACLATGPATPLQRRTEIFSQNIGSFRFTCNVDDNLNPFQDCFNTQARICNPTYMGFNATRLRDCKNGVDQMVEKMSSLWQAVRKQCGQWAWIDGFRGNKDSAYCDKANSDLINKAYYVADGSKIYVTSALTESVKAGLWSNTQLKG